MTDRSPVMGISIYKGNSAIGTAKHVLVDGEQVVIEVGTIERFEVLRYLNPAATRDLAGEKAIPNMPPLTLYCKQGPEYSSIVYPIPKAKKGGKKKVEVRDTTSPTITRITFQPVSIEVGLIPGQNLAIKSFKGLLLGEMEQGVELPQGLPSTAPEPSYAATTYY